MFKLPLEIKDSTGYSDMPYELVDSKYDIICTGDNWEYLNMICRMANTFEGQVERHRIARELKA